MTTIDTLIQEYETLTKNLSEQMQNAFKETFTKFWQDFPNIYAVVWNQYTPYFNDGDACVFGVHTPAIMTKEVYDIYIEDGAGWPDEYNIVERDYNKDRDNNYETKSYKLVDMVYSENFDKDIKINKPITLEEAQKAQQIINEIFKLPDHIFLGIFGDHCRIIATREGFEVEELNHD